MNWTLVLLMLALVMDDLCDTYLSCFDVYLISLLSEMKLLVEIATILSFLTAPFYAFFNYRLLSGRHTPATARPGTLLKVYSVTSILILLGFSGWYLSTLL